jgi:aminopeptidase
MVNGVLVKDLEMRFESGILTGFDASSGKDTFKQYLDSDAGARRLGEVALVGIDSPIFQSGLVYHEILLDENAACHIAVGSAYKFCIQDHESLSEAEFIELGCNESSVHTDIMISSEEVSVTATDHSGSTFQLIVNGAWAI